MSLGIVFGLLTTLCWCFSALAFEAAGKRIGSIAVNVYRLIIAFACLSLVGLITRGQPLPTDATAEHWTWLIASGFVGFFLGDLASFRALVLIGARLSAVVTCTAPIFTLAAEFILLPDSRLTAPEVLGIATTLAGVIWVVSERRTNTAPITTVPTPSQPPAPITTGLLLAFIGAACQGIGAVLTKTAFTTTTYSAFSTGQIRILAALPFFLLLVILTGRTRQTALALNHKSGMLFTTLGAIGGPFLGVTFFTLSLQHGSATITQTLVSLVPILMIPLAIAFKHERITPRAVLGTLIAVSGVFLLVNAD
jgi:drug/metabolite transporter (DMT)-like permease